MDTRPEAARLIEDYVEDMARRSGLPEPQRSDARRELHSHLWDAARSRANAAGADGVELEHARAAIGELGTRDEVDSAFFAIHRAELERAPFMNRAVAYIVDFVLLMIILNIVLGPILFFTVTPFGFAGDIGAFDRDPTPIGPDCSYVGTSPLFAPLVFLWTISYFAIIVAAFAAFEATIGQTPGKMAMRVRATTAGGGPLSWREAVLRNLVKGFPLLLLLDAILGHFAYGDDKKRISDHLAGTAVIREPR